MRSRTTVSAVVLIVPALLMLPLRQAAQQQAQPSPFEQARKLYEAGQDLEVLNRANAAGAEGQAPSPALLYLAAQSHERLKQPEQAKQRYGRLATLPETDPWRAIGQSGVLLADRQIDPALAAAQRAVAAAPDLPQAQYQLGTVLGHKQDFAGSAEAFVKAATLDPNYAYAHYYAGLSFYRARRIDLMATHFESFLRMAPQAPERGQVESIMRTIRH